MSTATTMRPFLAATAQDVERLGPWFHNLHLPDGTQTAPDHPLGQFPANKWRHIEPLIPADLSGWTVLDVGCNAGFYSFELARRGAQVTGVDCDQHYLDQAAWAADVFGLSDRVRFQRMQVYELAHVDKTWDLVWFMGVFYHLRYPMLWLEIVAMASRFHPNLYRELMGYPDDLPNLGRLRPPQGNKRPDGIANSCYERRKRGDLPETY